MFIGQEAAHQTSTVKVNTSYSLYQGVLSGVGIGALPTYISALSSELHPLELPLQLKFDLWLSFDRSLKKSRTVRAAIDWLHDCFDARRYPWFGDKFLHPRDFPKYDGFARPAFPQI